jgi:hypothetical protein
MSRRLVIKSLYAVMIGIPTTIAVLGFVGVLLLGTTWGIIESPKESIGFTIPMLAVIVASMIGLGGMWSWILLPQFPSDKRRKRTAIAIAVGLCVSVFLFLMDEPLATFFGVVALAFGGLMCCWLLRPETVLNPDRM